MDYENLDLKFKKIELVAILKVALDMASVDGNIDSIESDVIYTQMMRFGVTHEELSALSEDAILNMKPHVAMSIIDEMTYIQKQYVQALLVIIMSADGEIHETEMKVLQIVTMCCGLPPINMNDIRNAIRTFRNL